MWRSLEPNKVVTRQIILLGLCKASETPFKVWGLWKT